MDRKYYEAYDDRYRQVHGAALQWFADTPSPIVGQILERYGVDGRILEIGCGEGRDGGFLMEQGFDVLATDVSPAAIDYARKQFPGYAERFEVYRCRGIISDSPLYQAYLKQINDIKENYKDCLLLGRYNDAFGFTCPNENLDARSFVSEDGKKMTVVVAYQSRKKYGELTAEISAPGYRLIDSMTTGTGVVDGGNVKLGQYDLAALLFEKEQ